MTPGAGDAFTVLVVCTGNLCRSPAVEALLADGLAGSGVQVASAGLRACAGRPVAPQMARLLAVPPPPTTARQLVPAMVRGADLVLTATRDQRAAVVSLVPAAVRRTFTLREFVELAALARAGGLLPDGGPPGRALAAVVPAAPRLRARRRAGGSDDVEDPYGAGDEVFARVAAELHELVDRLLTAVRGGSPAEGTAGGPRAASPVPGHLPGRATADRVTTPSG